MNRGYRPYLGGHSMEEGGQRYPFPPSLLTGTRNAGSNPQDLRSKSQNVPSIEVTPRLSRGGTMIHMYIRYIHCTYIATYEVCKILCT